jgi:hypothetical protein
VRASAAFDRGYMKQSIWTTVTLVALFVTTLAITIRVGVAQLPKPGFEVPGPAHVQAVAPPEEPTSILSTACALRPDPQRTSASIRAEIAKRAASIVPSEITLDRFRQVSAPALSQSSSSSSKDLGTAPRLLQASYSPRERIVLIDPTNFGERYLKDVYGKPANLDPIVVLHETVGSANSALNFFRTAHLNDADQASYHTLITLDGTIIYLVPPDKRAFGAGNSMFLGSNGLEAVRTNPKLRPSVNNFAYHVSLETPPDGNDNGVRHSGYTEAQYQSLAWLVARTGVPNERITTHKAVDLSESRLDPRSFNFTRFMKLLNTYPRTSEIVIRCTDSTELSKS